MVKILGERNAGTNYLKRLLELNTDARVLSGVAPKWARWSGWQTYSGRDAYFKVTGRFNLGWKHRLAPSQAELDSLGEFGQRCFFLCLVKNPYSWIVSMYRRPYHAGSAFASLQEMIDSKWNTLPRERAPSAYRGIVEMWNAKARSYLQLPKDRTCIVKYEDLLASPEEVIDSCCRRAGLARVGDFKNFMQSTKNSSKNFRDYRDYYLNEKWRTKIGRREMAEVSRRLDRSVMAKLRYKIIS